MIKTILVPLSGVGEDSYVFATALALAGPLSAHMDFYHIRFTPCEAAVRTPHMEFCAASEVNSALDIMRHRDRSRSASVSEEFIRFCQSNTISRGSTPDGIRHISAELTEDVDDAANRLRSRARHSDMVVIGRPSRGDLLPYRLIEDLLMTSGRAILLAAKAIPTNILDTVVIGWSETAEAAHCIAFAMPLLELARRVVLVNIVEDGDLAEESLDGIRVNLAHHGVVAEKKSIESHGQTAALLQQAAIDLGATLLVVGAFGHKPLSEAVFGGVTRSLIDYAEVPVLLMH